MTFDVEVLLKESEDVISESVQDDGPEPAEWTDADVTHVLETMLRSIARAQASPSDGPPTVALRGLSWIVTPHGRGRQGVTIAIEIPSGAVVAGPFDIAEARLTTMIARVLGASGLGSTRVH